MGKKIVAVLTFVLVGIVGFMYVAHGDEEGSRPHFPHTTVSVTRSDGTVFSFQAEVATTPREQAYGLMFVRSMPEDHGMIFPYDPPQTTAFWMKNTLIPLDMLFIAPDKTIGHIVANARVEDLTPLDSQIPVSAVIEVNAGTVKKDGLAVGDRVSSPVF